VNLLLALTLLACTGKDPIDADQDGYPEEEDCDDTDAGVNAGADEVCDGVDNNCDGLVDDADPSLSASSAKAWYVDVDADDFGDFAVLELACEAPDGYVATGGDCNDADPEINPGATEVCDGVDNDCSGGADDAAVDAAAWYLDQDGDGFGQDGDVLQSCTPPAERVAEGGDCMDDNALVFPGAEEVCNDGIDNDCDADPTGDCGWYLSTADLRIAGTSSSEETGVALAPLGDLDMDGHPDFAIGARNHDGVATDAGAAFVVYGPVSSGSLTLNDLSASLLGEDAGDKAGRNVAAGDLDGDGVPDLVVTAPNSERGGNASGTAFLLFNPGRLPASSSLADASAMVLGDATYDYLGVGLQVVDQTGDGQADLLLGASGSDLGPDNAGAIFLLAGPFGAGTVDLGLVDPTASFEGAGNADAVGLDLRGGLDFDGDGLSDLLVGAGSNDSGGSDAGAVYLVSGPHSGAMALEDADTVLIGPAASGLGSAVGSPGDWDGDGLPELALGASRWDGTGGSDSGGVMILSPTALAGKGSVLDLALAVVEGEAANDQLGADLAANGDHDGDGQTDLLIGATNAGGDGSGVAYLFYGPVSGTHSAGAADVRFLGPAPDDHVGTVVRYLGDIAGMGVDAIGVSGLTVDEGASSDAGAAFIAFSTSN